MLEATFCGTLTLKAEIAELLVCVNKIRDTPPSVQANYTGNASTTPAKVLGRNLQRRALFLSSNATNGLFYWFGPSAPATTNPGIFVPNATAGIWVYFDVIGGAIQQELWITAQASNPVYFVSEFIDASAARGEGD